MFLGHTHVSGTHIYVSGTHIYVSGTHTNMSLEHTCMLLGHTYMFLGHKHMFLGHTYMFLGHTYMFLVSRTCHNSGSRSPFDTLSSALDVIFQIASIEHGFRATTLQNNIVLKQKLIQRQSQKVAGVQGRQPPGKSRGVWGAARPPMVQRQEKY